MEDRSPVMLYFLQNSAFSRQELIEIMKKSETDHFTTVHFTSSPKPSPNNNEEISEGGGGGSGGGGGGCFIQLISFY